MKTAWEPSFDALPPLIEHIPGVAFRLSHDGCAWRTWYVTDTISLYGYNPDEFRRGEKQWLHLVHPDDRVPVMKRVHDYETKGVNAFTLRYRIVKRNGDTLPVVDYNTVFRDDDGAVLCQDKILFMSIAEDRSLGGTREFSRQQTALNDILLRVHESDPAHSLPIILERAGTLLNVSRAILYRYLRDGAAARIEAEWCNADIPSLASTNGTLEMRRVPETAEALRKTGHAVVNFGEIPDGCRELFAAEGLIASIAFAVYIDGEPCGFVTFDDCVEERVWKDGDVRFLRKIANLVSTVLCRRRERESYERNRKTYEAVLDNVDSYIFAVRPGDDVIIFANRAFRSAFGDDCVGTPAAAHLGIDYRGILETGSGPAPGAGAYPEFYCEKSGEWLAVSGEIVTWVNGKPARLVNCYNVTAKKLFADAMENASRAKSDFLARTSHELRTPMNAIIGMAELILRESADRSVAGHARNIKQAGLSLLAIVNDILDFSKIESGKMEIVPIRYRLSSLLGAVISIIRVRMAEKGLLFTVNVDARLPDELRGDEARIRQILINLLNNALKFTDRGSVALEIVGSVDKAAKRTLLSMRVADTGSGIREEKIESLFQNFVQLDSINHKGVEGSGLGLPISKSLATAMGGDILVESRYGSGSVFTLVLPQEFDSPARVAEVADAAGKCVLVYETRKPYAESLRRTCRNLDVECHVATGGDEYADRLRERAYTHVFVADSLHRSARDLHDKLHLSSVFVTLAGGVPPVATGAISLEMPAQAMSVARALNGEAIDDAPDRPVAIAFAAPEARVLVVDDNHVNLQVAVGLMEPYGMRVDTCTSGREAVELVRRERYDLVFMDHLMPDMDGVEACGAIRALGGESRLLPIVALTANALSGMREMFLGSGMDDFVPKPIEMAALAATLERWIPAAKKKPAAPFRSVRRDGKEAAAGALDCGLGLRNLGGDAERYAAILSMFCDGAEGTAVALRESLAAGDADAFTIQIHSLKGASASIGAMSLSERAARLEEAGGAGDLDAAARDLDAFLDAYARLVDEARRAAADSGRGGSAPDGKPRGDAALLGGTIARLFAALRGRDAEAVRQCVGALAAHAWSAEVEEALAGLFDVAARSDFEAAEECARAVEAAFLAF